MPEDRGRSEVQRRLTAMDEILDEAMNHWRESGDLQRLAGKPLDLDDNSPEWFANRMLKTEGFSHPTIEKGRDVDHLLREAEAIAARYQSQAVGRPGLLEEYRAKLAEYNRAVTAFNVSVPDMLHKRHVRVAERVAELRSAP